MCTCGTQQGQSRSGRRMCSNDTQEGLLRECPGRVGAGVGHYDVVAATSLGDPDAGTKWSDCPRWPAPWIKLSGPDDPGEAQCCVSVPVLSRVAPHYLGEHISGSLPLGLEASKCICQPWCDSSWNTTYSGEYHLREIIVLTTRRSMMLTYELRWHRTRSW